MPEFLRHNLELFGQFHADSSGIKSSSALSAWLLGAVSIAENQLSLKINTVFEFDTSNSPVSFTMQVQSKSESNAK